jgi:hypothetical protein
LPSSFYDLEKTHKSLDEFLKQLEIFYESLFKPFEDDEEEIKIGDLKEQL